MSKFKTVAIIFLFGVFVFSCNRQNESAQTTQQESQKPTVFAKGEKAPTANFTGIVWVKMLLPADSTFNTSIGNVTFEPGARSNWHSHPAGQILLVTDGLGYYQEKGKPIKLIRKGDVVTCPPNVEHWHGASPKSPLTHIATNPNTQKGIVIWLKPVTDKEYNSFK